MRHDFLGANLQMLHLVEHGIEDDMPCAGANELLNLLRALVAATPDRNHWTEVGVFVTPQKPFAQPPLGANLVLVHGEINSFTVCEAWRIALRFVEEPPDHRRLTNERR